MNDGPNLPVNYRSALEALRNGVPNRDAVRALGCNQDEAERRFLEQLHSAGNTYNGNKSVPGLLVQGGFGTGKSHLLEYFEHLALTENFVCSRIVISKETPLYNPEKVFRAAVENGVVPDLSGQMIDEIAIKLDTSSQSYDELSTWANKADSGVSEIFPATLLLHERLNNDPELVQDIVRFWSGDRISITKIRQGLRSVGQAHAYNLRAVRARELAIQRFNFALHLVRGAGYKGWVILIDEIELISRYSILQRGRAYAELARWMGKVADEEYPGLVVVGTITDDFALERLQVGQDRDYVVPRLQARGTDEFNILAARAESGMRTIERESILLAQPDEASLQDTYSKLKDIHSKAYAWTPPDVPHGSLRTT
ncbi:MAG: DUF2791 family P-loop domain-containing protein, partial [Nitrososphaera sp.]|nr:DUF2791 family P-loop domain-containing protein [Nitrososphaera sp.]